ncbi:hypothetical protein A9Q84_13665 [Halobacteriovorax marinus]|uniref:Transmembrane protein n=1 Tax=Halobacteriovorax marinus TaxID=97084 RepID=A0A1Y5F8U4_9BACT|nr:hypothetical protein A9Q84_13665 [Halobacteriovorax marinus]
MNNFLKYIYGVDWILDFILKGRFNRNSILLILMSVISVGIATYLGGNVESNQSVNDQYLWIKGFSWILLFPVYILCSRKRISFYFLISFFIGILFFFFRYSIALLSYNLVMFFLILSVGSLFDLELNDFDWIDVYLNYVLGAYFYSQVFCFIKTIRDNNTNNIK